MRTITGNTEYITGNTECITGNTEYITGNTEYITKLPMRILGYKLYRDIIILPRLKIILPSSGLLCSVRCFETEVTGLSLGQAVQEGEEMIPKRRYHNGKGCATSQSKEQLNTSYIILQIHFYWCF
jgi:hypothetical protein